MQQYRKNLGKVSLTAEGAWNNSKQYAILSIVYDEHTQHGFISKKEVPSGVDLYNKEFWMPLNVSGYVDSNIIILNNKISESAIQSYTLEEAIKSISPVGRRPGIILCFFNSNTDRLDIGARWEIWQFNSNTISEWEDVNSWTNIYYNYNKFVGWYKSEDYLKKHFPFPEIGCYAFVGSELNEASVYRCDNKYVWNNTTQHAWDYVKVVVDGNVTVGENGNWFNNGEDTGIPASIKGENGKTPVFREKDNTIQYSFDNVNWITISDKVAAWFRWNATTGDTQANNVGRIQISRDNVTWTNLSGDIINNLHISRYIGADESLPTSGIVEGTIYAKGPSYDENDASHANPIYRLWVYAWKGNILAWQDNGEFTSIAAGVVQETGDSETEVMSQKAVTKKLSELGSEVEKHDRDLYISDEYIEPSYITKDSYIASNHNIVSMSGWNIIYIPVSEGDVYKIVGKVSGAWVAVICLVEDIDVFGSKGSVVVLSESNIKTDVNKYIDIPVGVKYIAISSGDVSAVRVYGKDNVSMIEKNGNKIKNIENKLTVEKDVSQISVSERVDNHYYTTAGVYAEDSYKSFHVEYYAVHEGQRIHLKGKYSGNIAAFILAPNKGEKAYYIYGQGTHGVQSEIDTIITVPSGINWLARSFSDTSTTMPYLVEEVDYLDYLDSKISKDEDFSLKLKGKRLLAIGDSITAQMYWQTKVGDMLGMNVRTHAKGGIGIIQMVDGDGSGEAPEGYDPDSFGASIYRLNTEDVKDVDYIILMGFYNTRGNAKNNRGEEDDMYPSQNTWCGQMNYAIKRVYEELDKSGNRSCKVVICSAHKYGKYPYNDESAYDDGQYLLDATKLIAGRHSLPLIDLMNNGNINMYNWNEFQASNSPYASDYIPSDGVNDGKNKPFESLDVAPSASGNANKYITVVGFNGCYQSDGSNWNKLSYPTAVWNADQLHLNRDGGKRIGEYIAKQLLTM